MLGDGGGGGASANGVSVVHYALGGVTAGTGLLWSIKNVFQNV